MTTRIIIVGTTTFDVRQWGSSTQIVPGGSGFNAAAAVALSGAATVSLVTTFARPEAGPVADFYDALINTGSGIAIIAREGARPPISVYEGDEAVRSKKPTRQHRDEKYSTLDLSKVPGIDKLSGNAAIFVGSPSWKAETRPCQINYARQLSAKDVITVWNANARDPIELSVHQEWANAAQIITLSKRDIERQFKGSPDERIVSERYFEMRQNAPNDARLICVTDGGNGCTAYWEGDGTVQSQHFSVPGIRVKGGDQDGAGDAFAAAMGIAAAELAAKLNCNFFNIPLNRYNVEKLVNRAQGIAGAYVQARNRDYSDPLRPEVFKVLRGCSCKDLMDAHISSAASP